MKDKMGKSFVLMFFWEGEYFGKWGQLDECGFVLGVYMIYIEMDGMFWIIDWDGYMVKKFVFDGEFFLIFGIFGEWGDDENYFNGLMVVLVQDDGVIVVVDGYWNLWFVWFVLDGEYIKLVGGWGCGLV